MPTVYTNTDTKEEDFSINEEGNLVITFTDSDINTICWVSDMYCWSTALGKYVFSPGELELSLEEADDLVEEFICDTEGGHDYFPCLNPASELAAKLAKIVNWVQENKV